MTDRWLRAIKRINHTLETLAEYNVSFATHCFIDAIITSWEALGYTYNTQGTDWMTFENLFRESYFNIDHSGVIANEFELFY